MKEYNAAFFGLYENLFLLLKENLGEERALELFRQIMERGLRKAYDSADPPFRKGSPQDFTRLVGARDEGVGLRVEFPEVTESRIVYRFHTDLFPGLMDQIAHEKLDDTYMAFKVRYLLGEGWTYNN